MATFGTDHGSSGTSLTVTNLHSLANGSFWKSASVNFDTNGPMWVEIQLRLVTASSGAGSANGYANLYIARSIDNSAFNANISSGEGAWTSTNPTLAVYAKSLQFLKRLAMETTQTASYTWDISAVLQNPPKYCVFVVENQCGKALSSSGNTLTYLENKLISA